MIDQIKNELREGELYAGVILGKNGEHDQHVVLLPGDTKSTWETAKEWAASIGGDLPTRREQSLLFANLSEEFERDWYWYWSSEQHGSSSAWVQGFSDGYQFCYSRSDSYRARAVRRFSL